MSYDDSQKRKTYAEDKEGITNYPTTMRVVSEPGITTQLIPDLSSC